MQQKQHRIQKYTFDVDFDSEDLSFEFQNRIAAYVKETIVALTDEIFSEVSQEDVKANIHKLVIDLGEISYNDFENDFYYRLRSQLTDKLRLILAGFHRDLEEKAEFVSEAESSMSVLTHFFETGTLPWSVAKSETPFSVNDLIRKILESPEIPQFKRRFSALAAKEETRVRIFRQIHDGVLWDVVRLWAGADTESIIYFYKETVKAFEARRILKKNFAEYRELLWEYVLRDVVVAGRSDYSLESLVESYFTFVAGKLHLDMDEVILAYYPSLPEDQKIAGAREIIQSSFYTAILQVSQKRKQEFRQPKDRKAADDGTEENTERKKTTGVTGNPPSADAAGETDELSFDEIERRREERQEALRKERDKRRQEYLRQVFRMMKEALNVREFRGEIARVENLVSEYLATRPLIIKRIFEDIGLNLAEIKDQYIFELFSPGVQELILEKIFQLKPKAYADIRMRTLRGVFRTFFATGIFPYHQFGSVPDRKEIERLFVAAFKGEEKELRALTEEFITSKTGKEKVFRIAQLQKNITPKVLARFFAPYPEIIDPVSSASVKAFSEQYQRLEDFKLPGDFIYVLRYYLQEKSLPAIVEYSLPEAVAEFVTRYPAQAAAYFVSLKEKENKILEKVVIPEIKAKIAEAVEVQQKKQKALRQALEEGEAVTENETDVSNDVEQRKKKPSKQDSSDPVYEYKKLEAGEPIYINNAGLVILHPYLTRFFKMLQLVEKRDFVDEIAAHKAVYLLQYMVNKGINNEEHELVLNKILCGIDLETPLMRDIEITEKEKETCEELLSGVIQNWPILKSTTNDNLRASFIMREGRLLLDPQGWKLKVEERGYDILVERLPWAIAMVKLPWMKYMMYVEWK